MLKSYAIGDDVLCQTKTDYSSPLTDYFLYDGHGSTRQLSDAQGDVTAQYTYDSYGVMLGQTAGAQQAQATSLLYSGERFDPTLQQYYLRARHYNPANGQFTSLDPYRGNPHDPQSLHKYAYCHTDPVNGVDPSGEMLSLGELAQVTFICAVLGAIAFGSYTYYKTRDAQKALLAAIDGAVVGGSWGAGMYLWLSGLIVVPLLVGLLGTEVYLTVRKWWTVIQEEVASGNIPRNGYIYLPTPAVWIGLVIERDGNDNYTFYFGTADSSMPFVPVGNGDS